MKTVIMAGGKGTRISSVTNEIPKPMIRVCEKPILEWQINCLSEQGFNEITIITGHLGSQIHEYFADGSSFGVNITYYHEVEPLGTAGALLDLQPALDDDFLLINGDIIFDIDLNRMLKFHKNKGARVTLATHPNAHPFDSALVVADENGCVTNWLHKEEARTIYKNRVNAGIHLISPDVLKRFEKVGKLDLDRDVLKPFIQSKAIFAYDTPEYIHDMGTPERYAKVCADVADGKVSAKSLRFKQKAVFIDRDGTINVYKEYITKWENMELIEGVAEAIKAINSSGYLAIVVTNQPIIARGDCTWEELRTINDAMETLLGAEGAYIDDLFICPHHPRKGYKGERPEYKIECNCRKPKPGMLLEAAKKYDIDLEKSYMIGDHLRDVDAGIAVGSISVLLGNGEETDNRNVIVCDSLKMFVDTVLCKDASI